MDYLVVAPNKPYYHWQLAILGQSFKLCGLQENLCILLVDTDVSATKIHYKRFIDLPRLHATLLRSDSDPDIMRLDGIAFAVSNQLVSPQFVVLPPHCVLRNPVKKLDADISFKCQPDFTFAHLHSFGIAGDEIVRRMEGKRQWLPVGEVYGFKGIKPEFFTMAAERARLIGFDSYRKLQKAEIDKNVKGLFRAGMSLATLEHMNRHSIDTSLNLECQMTDTDFSSNFVNYNYGSPPDFNKMYYKMDDSVFSLSDNPFSAIMRANPTPAADVIKKVVITMNHPS